jgi:Flp pilus assembly protein TadD
VELDPSHVNAQVALGIAALRDRDTAAARAPLEKAVVLEPRNPFARRTLGQLLLMEDETAAALPHLRAAAEVAADDPINLFTDAQALLASDEDSHVAEASAARASRNDAISFNLRISSISSNELSDSRASSSSSTRTTQTDCSPGRRACSASKACIPCRQQ